MGFGCRGGNGVWRNGRRVGMLESVRKGEEREGGRQSLFLMNSNLFFLLPCIYFRSLFLKSK